MSELVSHATDYEIVEGEPPELLGRNLNSGAHLFASATAFFFLAFVFAYFYLRSLNNADKWRPKHIDPSLAYGTIVMALIVLSALLVRIGLLQHRAGRRAQWRRTGVVALALGIAGVVVQVIEWTAIGFGPADGGYASVFFGWTMLYVVAVLITLYRVEIAFAAGLRNRGREEAAVPEGFVPGAMYWDLLAAIGVLAWIILYLV